MAAAQPYILVIDDSPHVHALVKAQLEAQGLCVVVAEDGAAGLAAAAERLPSLILLDVVLPDMDGYELCRRFRAGDATRAVPLVMLTGLTGQEAKIHALEIGADDFLSKPFDGAELLARVRSRIRAKQLYDEVVASRDALAKAAGAAQSLNALLHDQLAERMAQLEAAHRQLTARGATEEQLVRRLELADELSVAIGDHQLMLHYQPKLSLATGQVVGAEALVRWQHPQRGLLMPDAFIPLAESTPWVHALAHWVLDLALEQCHQWGQAGLHMPVAVNLSARNLHDARLQATVAGLLHKWNVPAPSLTLEVTESALVSDFQYASQVLAGLRGLGVRLSIDDFGTGYSSLAYLRELRVDELKIDKSFILGLEHDPPGLAIVRTIVELAHSLGLHVVAEGVETLEARDILANLGCETAQGYYWYRPTPPAPLLAWMQSRPLSQVLHHSDLP